MFILVKDANYNDELIINTNNISYIHEASNTILLNGVNGTGIGLIRLDDKSIKKILEHIEII